MKKYKRNSINLKPKRIAIFVVAIILVQALCPIIGKLKLATINYAAVSIGQEIESDGVIYRYYAFQDGKKYVTVNKILRDGAEIQKYVYDSNYSVYEVKQEDNLNMFFYPNVKTLTVYSTFIRNVYNWGFVKNVTIKPDYDIDYRPSSKGLLGSDNLVHLRESPIKDSFRNSNIEKITLDYGFNVIDNNALENMKNLKYVYAPSSLVHIRKFAFSGCTNLCKFEWNGVNNLESIDEYAFFGCTNFEGNILGENVTYIGYDAFYNCVKFSDNIASLKNIKLIGERSFYNCKNIKGDIVFPRTLTEIDNDAFWGTSITSIKISSSMIKMRELDFESQIFHICDSKVPIYVPRNSVAYEMLHSTQNCIEYDDTYNIQGTTYSLRSSTSKEYYAVLKNYNGVYGSINIASKIKIEGVEYKITEIGDKAFSGKNISSIWVPNTIEKIGNQAFSNCTGLTDIYLGSNTQISTNAFLNDKKLTIHAPTSSPAKIYANKYNINFKAYDVIENQPETTSSSSSNNKTIKKSGTVNINKNNNVSVDKTPPVITATCTDTQDKTTINWSATDNRSEIIGWKWTNSGDESVGSYETDSTKLPPYGSVSGLYETSNIETKYLYVKDASGNWTSMRFDIAGDRRAPAIENIKISNTNSYGVTKQNAIIQFTANDGAGIGITSYKISKKADDWYGSYLPMGNNNWANITYESTQTISENGTYYLYVKDANENVSYQSFNVTCIDKTAPKFTIQPTVEVKDSYAMIRYGATDDSGKILAWKLSTKADGSDGTYKNFISNGCISEKIYGSTSDIKVTKSGTYYVVIKDAAGNERVSSAIKVDVTPPKITKIKKISSLSENETEKAKAAKTISGVHYLKENSELKFVVTFNEEIDLIDKSKVKTNGLNVDVDVSKINSKECIITIKGKTGNGSTKITFEKGLVTDKAGNKSKECIPKSDINIVLDNAAPVIQTSYNDEENKRETKITDFSRIARYQWGVVKTDGTISWKTNHKNLSIKEKNHNWSNVKYKKLVLYVEDILGNSKTYTIDPYVNATVKFVSKEGDINTYRITTNVKAQIDYKYKANVNNFLSGNTCKVEDLIVDPEDTMGNKFLLKVKINENTNKETFTLPKGIIFAYGRTDSREAEIEVSVDNEKPLIFLGNVETAVSPSNKVSFHLTDNWGSGISKYEITRDGKVLRRKTVNKASYTDSITFINNGKIKLTVWDAQGNSTEKEFDITNIDRKAPKVSKIEYKALEETGEVEVTITANEKIVLPEKNMWESINDKTIKGTFKESELMGTKTSTVTITDEAGNTTEVVLSDKIAPKVVGEIQKSKNADGSTKVVINFSEEVELTKDLTSEGWQYNNNSRSCIINNITADTNITVQDFAGNESEPIKIEIDTSNTTTQKLFKNTKYTPSNRNEPTTEVVKEINLNREIQSVNLGKLEGKVQCELTNNNTTVKLTFKQNTESGIITLIENEQYSERLNVLKVSNIVIKGDSNNDGKIDKDDYEYILSVVTENIKETDKYKIFAMDMNDDGIIDMKDVNILKKKL